MSVHPREAERFSVFDYDDLEEVETNPVTGPAQVTEPRQGSTVPATVMATTSYMSTPGQPAATPASTAGSELANESAEDDARGADTTSLSGGTAQSLTQTSENTPSTDPFTSTTTASSDGSSADDRSPVTSRETVLPSVEGSTNSAAAEESNDMSNAGNGVNIHARRRMGVVGALAALSLAVFSGNVGIPFPSALPGAVSQAATPSTPDAAATENATQQLRGVLEAAQAHRAANGTYRGFPIPVGVSVVSANDVIVIATVIDGACWYNAIVPGYDQAPRWDATASRCNPDRLAQLQARIDISEQ